MGPTSIRVDAETHAWLAEEARISGLSIRKVFTTLVRHARLEGWHIDAHVVRETSE